MKFNYYDFIKSEWWEKQKLDWYSRHKKKCAKCEGDKVIQLHHKQYPKNGRYLSLRDNAFVALCKNCHKKYHSKNGVSGYMQTATNRFIRGKRGQVISELLNKTKK